MTKYYFEYDQTDKFGEVDNEGLQGYMKADSYEEAKRKFDNWNEKQYNASYTKAVNVKFIGEDIR